MSGISSAKIVLEHISCPFFYQKKLGRNMLIRWSVKQFLRIFTEQIFLVKKCRNSEE